MYSIGRRFASGYWFQLRRGRISKRSLPRISSKAVAATPNSISTIPNARNNPQLDDLVWNLHLDVTHRHISLPFMPRFGSLLEAISEDQRVPGLLGKYTCKCLGGDRDDDDGDSKRQQRRVGRPIDQKTRAGRSANDQRDQHAR
jgi:hypothetical protein